MTKGNVAGTQIFDGVDKANFLQCITNKPYIYYIQLYELYESNLRRKVAFLRCKIPYRSVAKKSFLKIFLTDWVSMVVVNLISK